MEQKYGKTEHLLQKLTEIHFSQGLGPFFDQQVGNKLTLYALLLVSGFLLLLGSVNYINLTTAYSIRRAKEIGIRKTLGSSRSQLIIQILCETLILTVLSGVLSLLLLPVLLNLFSNYIPEGVRFDIFRQIDVSLFFIILILVVSIISGIYPAFVLSKFQPISSLRNKFNLNLSNSKSLGFRKTSIIFQFIIAQFFIIATLIIVKQIHFSINKNLGYSKNLIITFPAPSFNSENKDKRSVLTQSLKSIAGIEFVSVSGDPPVSQSIVSSTIKFINNGQEFQPKVINRYADSCYFKLYEIELIAGRNLIQSDTAKEYVINETCAKALGYNNPAEVIGQFINPQSNRIPIVGVISDFHTNSMHEEIQPVVFTCDAEKHKRFHVSFDNTKYTKKNIHNIITKIRHIWKELYPEKEFNFSFIDDRIKRLYKKEYDTVWLSTWCTGLSIVICCLGLLGLVIFSTNQRAKEVVIRKIFGASTKQIISLLTSEYLKLITIAFTVASPLAWWFMHLWLNNFAYRTEIELWIFFVSGFTMLSISMIILVTKTLSIALSNPIESIRTE